MKNLIKAYIYAKYYLDNCPSIEERKKNYSLLIECLEDALDKKENAIEGDINVVFDSSSDKNVLEIVFRAKISTFLKTFLSSSGKNPQKHKIIECLKSKADYFLLF